MMFTAVRTEADGQISSVVRFNKIQQARDWALINGHLLVQGYEAKKAIKSGAPVRWMHPDGRIGF